MLFMALENKNYCSKKYTIMNKFNHSSEMALNILFKLFS